MSNPAAAARPAALSLAPLDVPLSIEVGRALDANVVADACRGWEGTPSGAKPLRISIQGSPNLAGRGDGRITMSGLAMEIEGPGVRARAEPCSGRASCLVSDDYLADPASLREEVLEPLMLRLVTHSDRAPIHASGFIVDGLAIILAGRSGAGKSCLARTADAAGFQLLSDDAVYVQRSPRLRVWGWPSAVHLLPQDSAGQEWPTRVRNGKTKFVVPLRSASQVAVSCERAVLCVLSRGESPELVPISADEAIERLWPLDPGFDLLQGPIGAAVRTLAERGACELRLSDNPNAALDLLLASLPQLKSMASSQRG